MSDQRNLNDLRTIPRAPGLDHTLALGREGYNFIINRCERLDTDIFETRLLLRRAVCMRGTAAAEIFYAGDRFTRVGAMPISVLKLLQDYGSVQLLDGAAHRRRKRMFLAIGSPPEAARLASFFAYEWSRSLERWEGAERVVLFDELRPMLTRAVTAWAGVPLDEADVAPRTRELSEMVEGTGSVGPRNWRALWLRRRTERWARGIIAAVRSGEIPARGDSALGIIAAHRDLDGQQLDVKTAAVELLNVLRAVVAVARFIVFAAKALHEHPDARRRIAGGDRAYLDHFVQEVRRLSPFFSFIGGRVRRPFEWRGYAFPKGKWVILDLYGTNRDPRSWKDPAAFRPERFAEEPNRFEFVPQGAGDAALTHRCPGEELTVRLMKTAARLLLETMRYEVPDQDLSVDLARFPALPKSGLVISRPRRIARPAEVPSHVAASSSL
jgi:fatty-acid peroxygenase